VSKRLLAGFGPLVLAALGAWALTAWIVMPSPAISMRVPEQEAAASATSGQAAPNLHGQLTLGPGHLPGPFPKAPGAWPGWRGPDRNGIARSSTALARKWPEGGPKKLWEVTLGEGHAGAAIYGGCVYVLDYDRAAQADALRCLSLADGQEIWRYSYPLKIRRNHGMSRTVPAVNEKYVVAIGPLCHVTCVERATGKLLWGIDLVGQFGAEVPPWYAGQCPLLEGDKVILAPAGPEALLVAVDCATGQVLWKSENPRRWAMSHSSIVPMDALGKHMYLYAPTGGVAGVSSDGQVLFATDQWKISIATVPSPLVLDGGKIFFSGGYNSGSLLARVSDQAGQVVLEDIKRLPASVFDSEQQTPLYYNGRIWGLREDSQLACLDNQANLLWASGPKNRIGKGGNYLLADGLIYAMSDNGKLYLIDANQPKYALLDAAQVIPDGQDSWGPMALADGRLLARDLTRLVCLDVGASK